MAKKKNFITRYFGKKFGFWDLILIGVLGGAIWFLATQVTLTNILTTLSWIIIGLTLTPLITKTFRKIQRRARK